MCSSWLGVREVFRVAPLLLLVGTVGCGRYYPVHGKVTLDDGTAVTAGMVVFETKDVEKPVTARGDIQPDGSYQLSTERPGDGVPPGRYRVLVTPPPQGADAPPQKPPFDMRYASFATSRLEFEVKSGSNDYPIQLKKDGPEH
jgi:hypothetical protein